VHPALDVIDDTLCVTLQAHIDGRQQYVVASSDGELFTQQEWAAACAARDLEPLAMAALLLELVAVLITLQTSVALPSFAVRGAFPLLALVFVALEFGAEPSLAAALTGAFLLDFLLLPPYLSLGIGKGASLAGVVIFLVVQSHL
jgi:K+-sensing histidine kinase KdpD